MGDYVARTEPLMEYRKEYEKMTPRELEAEYKHLREQTQSQEVKDRYRILVALAKERGYVK